MSRTGPIIEMTGRRFGRWLVIRLSKRRAARGWTKWICRCDCGTTRAILGAELRRGKTQSCGCLSAKKTGDRFRKHGLEGTPAYMSWSNMIQRCCNSNDPRYRLYGGRGIKVCVPWQKFSGFYADMGARPKGLTLERINNDGNYEPSNCKWASRLEQAGNTRNNIIVTLNGRSQCLAAWARELGLPDPAHVTRNDIERCAAKQNHRV